MLQYLLRQKEKKWVTSNNAEQVMDKQYFENT